MATGPGPRLFSSLSITDNFIIRLNQCRIEINAMFSEIIAKLDKRQKELLAVLDNIENRHNESNKAKENFQKLENILKGQNDLLASMEDAPNLMGPRDKVNLEQAIKQTETKCSSWKLKKEEFSNVSVDFAITGITDCINQLGDITLNKPENVFSTTPVILCDATGTGAGELSEPEGLALDMNDTIYVTDLNKILVFSIEGLFIREFGQEHLNGPHNICITKNNVYISNYGSHSIVKFNLSGKFINKIGSKGNNNKQFNCPHGIAYNNFLLFICDWNNHRIQILNEKFTWQRSITHEDIKYPLDIKILTDTIYVSTDHSIHLIAVGGSYVRKLPYKFEFAEYFALDNNNNIIISDNGTETIVVFSLLDNSIKCSIRSSKTAGVAVTKHNKIVNVCTGTNPKLLSY